MSTNKMMQDNFKIIKKLGNNRTFLVEPSKDPGTRVVFKQAPPGRLEAARFLDAAGIWKDLDHPAFPRLISVDKQAGRPPYILAEYIAGKSLEEEISEGPVSEHDAVYCAAFTTEAIAYLHKKNPPVLFCDLKPSHIIKKPGGGYSLIDLELLTVYKRGKVRLPAKGTPGFSPPEQSLGLPEPRSDIFSIGAMLCRLVTGKPPEFLKQNEKDISHGLYGILKRCLADVPSGRYPDAGRLLCDLENFMLRRG
ncbi:MAG: hypothetical protein M1269_02865 [Chloroflexi bacterium]|nr:hypothetical protein [Chloroflexota bacterium]